MSRRPLPVFMQNYSLSQSFQAIGFMLLSMACFSAMNTAIRFIAGNLPSTEVVLLRNIFSLLLIVSWQIIRTRKRPHFTTQRMSGHFWRATAGICAMEAWFYSLTILPLTLATALSFTTPIFATIIAIIWLGEKAGLRRWAAIMTGFIGMLIILRPGTDNMSAHALFVIFSSVMMAIAGTLVKSLTRTESPETIVFFMALFMIPWSILPVIGQWQHPDLHTLAIVFCIALLSTVAHLLLARAFIRADMVTLMPFDFTRLIFTAFFAYILFAETLDMPTILGSAIIVGSAVYIAHREARTAKRAQLSDPQP
jgi:drug/metabolite transporter (DMT)-like permease